MPSLRKKFSLGIFIDGQQLYCALLSRIGQRTQIELLESFALEQPLLPEDKVVAGIKVTDVRKKSDSGHGEDNPFELDIDFGGRKERSSQISEVSNNVDVLIRLLHTMCPRESQLAFNLIDTYVLYKNIDGLPAAAPVKIKRAIWQDLFVEAPNETKLENIGYIRNGAHRCLAMVHDDPMVFSTLLFESMKIMRSKPPQVGMIDTAEFAMAHALLQNGKLRENETTAVALFAQSYAKLFFFRGRIMEEVLPTIHESSDSEHVCDTLFSKMLFELDSGKIASINRMIVTGDVDRTRAESYFQGKLTNTSVERFDFSHFSLGHHVSALAGRTAPWSPAIALAAKTIDDKSSSPYRQNFLPRRIRDRQSVYRIAWHGMLLLGFLFSCFFFLTYQYVTGEQEINKLRRSSAEMEKNLSRLGIVAHEVDSLRVIISTLETGSALVDSLKSLSVRWSPVLNELSAAYSETGPFSLKKLNGSADGRLLADIEISRRGQVAELERLIKPSTVLSVSSQEDKREPLTVVLECRGVSAAGGGALK